MLKAKESQYINSSDKKIIEALERLFIIDLPKIEVPIPPKLGAYDFDGELADFKSQLATYDENIATNYEIIKWLRILLVSVIVFSVMRIFFSIVVEDELISGFHKMYTSFFFGLLFIMLHIETNNQSRILLCLAYVSLYFSFW